MNEAVAEHSLAVRAAHGRPSSSQLERSLLVLGHVMPAVNQHARQERVRSRGPRAAAAPPAPSSWLRR
jgi:hypothetical protein